MSEVLNEQVERINAALATMGIHANVAWEAQQPHVIVAYAEIEIAIDFSEARAQTTEAMLQRFILGRMLQWIGGRLADSAGQIDLGMNT